MTKQQQYATVCIDHNIFIHSSVNKHMGFCSQVLAVVNNTAANMGVQRSLQYPDFNFVFFYIQAFFTI